MLCRAAQAREAGDSSADVAASLASYAALLSATVAPEDVTPLGFTQRHVRCLQHADAACAPAPGAEPAGATRGQGEEEQLPAQLFCARLMSTPHDDGTGPAGGAAATVLRAPWPMSAEWQSAHAALSAAITDNNNHRHHISGHASQRGREGSGAEVPPLRRRRGVPDAMQQPPLRRRRREEAVISAAAMAEDPPDLPDAAAPQQPAPPSLAAWAMAMTAMTRDLSRRGNGNALPDNGDDTDDAFLYGLAGTGLSPPRFPSIDALPPMPLALFEQMLRDAALP